MKYTPKERELARELLEAARAKGEAKPRAIAVAVGLSRPAERHVTMGQPTAADYLPQARSILAQRKQTRRKR